MVYVGKEGSPNGSSDVVVVELGDTVVVDVDSAGSMLVTGAAEVVEAAVVEDGSASSPEQAATARATPKTQLKTKRSFTIQSYRACLFAHALVAVSYGR